MRSWLATVPAFIFLMGLFLIGTVIPRWDFSYLMIALVVLVSAQAWLIKSDLSWRQYFGLGLILRISLMISLPSLSDDYFRFIWDGLFVLDGVNPFHHLPLELADGLDGGRLLYENLNSQRYYSIYPPLSQFLFALSAMVYPLGIGASVLVLRLLVLGAEVGIFFLLKAILERLGREVKVLNWYWLSPMVILEFIGNLHFEVFVILFLLLGIYALLQQKVLLSAMGLAMAIGIKIVPIIFVPIFFFKLKGKSRWIFALACLALSVLFFLPFMDGLAWQHFGESLQLYFGSFEFNSFLYRLFVLDLNLSSWIPRLIFISAAAIIVWSAFKGKKDWLSLLFWMLMAQLLTSQMAHPWYWLPVLALGVLSTQRWFYLFPLVVCLSYATYISNPYHQIGWLVYVQYGLLALLFLFRDRLNGFLRSS